MTRKQAVLNRLLRWVSALRSGKYKQTKGILCKGGKFCATGVASDLYNKDMRRQKKKMVHFYDDGSETWVGRVAKYYGFEYDDCLAELPASHEAVTELNDSGKSFKYIADRIKEEIINNPEFVDSL